MINYLLTHQNECKIVIFFFFHFCLVAAAVLGEMAVQSAHTRVDEGQIFVYFLSACIVLNIAIATIIWSWWGFGIIVFITFTTMIAVSLAP